MSVFRGPQPRLSPEWVRIWVCSSAQILRPSFSPQKRKKRPEISRFQVFYGCGGRTRTCGLRVMSCSEAPIPCSAMVSRIFYPRKSRKTRRPSEFASRLSNGHSPEWVSGWVSPLFPCFQGRINYCRPKALVYTAKQALTKQIEQLKFHQSSGIT